LFRHLQEILSGGELAHEFRPPKILDRPGRRRKRTQDGRPLRRYLRRWKIERLFAWLKNFRRISSRWERHATNFLGTVQLGCVLILLRRL
jgi:transposase